MCTEMKIIISHSNTHTTHPVCPCPDHRHDNICHFVINEIMQKFNITTIVTKIVTSTLITLSESASARLFVRLWDFADSCHLVNILACVQIYRLVNDEFLLSLVVIGTKQYNKREVLLKTHH